MLEPDNALLCNCRNGLAAASEMLAPVLRRHGILLRGDRWNARFRSKIQRLCTEALADPTADPHRFWPSANGGLYLAVMRWNAEHCIDYALWRRDLRRPSCQHLPDTT